MSSTSDPTPVTLDNCDTEPIHIPGSVQPHGVLLACDPTDLRVRSASANAAEVLGIATAEIFALTLPEILDAPATALVRANLGARSWKRFNPIAATVRGRSFDAILHRSGPYLVVELEPHALAGESTYRDYGTDTHQALLRLQGADSLADLLDAAVGEVRRVTGYDRVMVYRFDVDQHGEVVAEERRADLEPFLGLHYPASDIPAQARRLYVANPIRIIADVAYRPAALVSAPDVADAAPLDLTHATLRSVSPIHVEYLRNMGVAASMSVSLLQDGGLWGLIACHHYAPKLVPYSVRMTCELVGQTLATLIQAWERREEAAVREAIGARKLRVLERLARADYLAAGLLEAPADLLDMVGADGAAMLEDGRCTRVGTAPPEHAIRAFAAWMASRGDESIVTHQLARDFPDAPALGTDAAGVVALALPQTRDNVLVWFRPVVARTVAWAGNPEKTYDEGPHGPRLTPRGSFALWRETVEHQSERWSDLEIAAAMELRSRLVDVLLRKTMEAERAREMLLGMVSHDLRNPLGAISLAAQVLEMKPAEQAVVTRTSARIAASSDRMRRMIEQLLDYTRTKSGSLRVEPAEMDLVALCRYLAEEIEGAHPGFHVTLELPDACRFVGDRDRIAQVISNLLGNARHHGDPAQPTVLTLTCTDAEIVIGVRNQGPPIPPEQLPLIFEPFKREPKDARTRRNAGLGLGLFIVKELVTLHRGTVTIASSSAEGTVCTVRLPRVDWTPPGPNDPRPPS
jgi:light-regulated signal transduction histidine kinase (bacteriophytochrome)